MAQMSLSCRSAADVNCLQVLQQMAEDLFLITLPEATHTCITVILHVQNSASKKVVNAAAAACKGSKSNFGCRAATDVKL